MDPITTLPLLLVLATPIGAQHGARTPVPVSDATQSQAQGATVAVDGDLSAVLFEDDATQRVFVAVSDGRGLQVGSPVRIDDDPSGADKETGPMAFENGGRQGLAVRGQRILALWKDERNAGTGGAGGDEAVDLYLGRSVDGGATWLPNVLVPKGHPAGGISPVTDFALAVSDDGQDVFVLQRVDPNYWSSAATELWLARSHDGGATFLPPLRVAAGSAVQYGIRFALDGDTLHVAYTGTPGLDLSSASFRYHTRSLDGGASFSTPQLLSPSPAGTGGLDREIYLDASGGTVAVGWRHEPTGSFATDSRVTVSSDGGLTFGPELSPASGPGGRDEALIDDLIVTHSGTVLVSFGSEAVHVSRSVDQGASWLTDTEIPTAGTVITGALASSGADVVATWGQYAGPFPAFHPVTIHAAFSRDEGQTWTESFQVAAGPEVPASPQIQSTAIGSTYDNVLCAWAGDGDDSTQQGVVLGGFRLPELIPVGFSSGGSARVDLSCFDGFAPQAWVLFSSSPGTLPLPFGDGRDLGLTSDAFLAASIADPATFVAPVAADGSGSTSSFPLPLAPGTTVYAAAVSFALGSEVTFGELTDAIQVVVQ